jgi:hypothetical protein
LLVDELNERRDFLLDHPMRLDIKKLKYKFILVIGFVLLVSFGVLLSYRTTLQNNLVIGQPQQQARMVHHQLILTRQWFSDHQNLFIVKTDEVKEKSYPINV